MPELLLAVTSTPSAHFVYLQIGNGDDPAVELENLQAFSNQREIRHAFAEMIRFKFVMRRGGCHPRLMTTREVMAVPKFLAFSRCAAWLRASLREPEFVEL